MKETRGRAGAARADYREQRGGLEGTGVLQRSRRVWSQRSLRGLVRVLVCPQCGSWGPRSGARGVPPA